MRYLAVATLSTTLPAADPDRDDVAVEIDGYRQEGANDETLFVPIRDKTTGQQTFDGGRYIELAADRSLETGDEIVVDFNLAYTPFCAYSEAFECPKPPETNWIDVAIPAGERAPWPGGSTHRDWDDSRRCSGLPHSDRRRSGLRHTDSRQWSHGL